MFCYRFKTSKYFVGDAEDVVAVKGCPRYQPRRLLDLWGSLRKSILQTILYCYPQRVIRGGRVLWEKRRDLETQKKRMKKRWTEMALVVQSALTSLNPANH